MRLGRGYPAEGILADNSTSTLLTNGSVFTGEWADVGDYDTISVAVKTDQNGYYSVQFSPDGTNVDSTLTRYYRTNQIEAPHNFTITRRYARVVFTNDSGSDQTYLRLQTLLGSRPALNAPIDSTLAQDFDATVTRPTDYNTEVALGLRQGHTLWNKFGYNPDVDVGTEVVASWGGTFTPLTTATEISIVSTDIADDAGGTGCNSVYIYGIDENRNEAIKYYELNGTTPVVTTGDSWLGINRIAMFLCGTGQVNAGTITATAVTGGSTMGQMPAGGGVTQQCIFHVPAGHTFVAEWIRINVLNKLKDAELTLKMWVYSSVSNGKQEVYRVEIDTQVNNDIDESPLLPFPITASTVVWLECTSNKADVSVNARFSGVLVRDNDL